MKARIISFLLPVLLENLNSQVVKEALDDLIDIVENKETTNPLTLVLCKAIRSVLNIPDDIGGDED